MANKVPDNWESLDWYVGPRVIVATFGAKTPYNLFGLKGESTRDITEAWYGRPENRYGTPEETRNATWSGVLYILAVVPPAALFERYLGESDLIRGWLEAHPFVVTLAWLVTVALLLYWWSPAQQQRRNQRQQEARKRQESGVLTVALKIPGGGLFADEPTIMTRRRGDPVRWSRDLPPGRVLLVLEGLRPDEAKGIYDAVAALNPSE